MFNKKYADKYPESFDPAVPRDLVFSGRYGLTDVEPETGITVGKLVLSPTRTYAPVIKKMLEVGLLSSSRDLLRFSSFLAHKNHLLVCCRLYGRIFMGWCTAAAEHRPRFCTLWTRCT